MFGRWRRDRKLERYFTLNMGVARNQPAKIRRELSKVFRENLEAAYFTKAAQPRDQYLATLKQLTSIATGMIMAGKAGGPNAFEAELTGALISAWCIARLGVENGAMSPKTLNMVEGELTRFMNEHVN